MSFRPRSATLNLLRALGAIGALSLMLGWTAEVRAYGEEEGSFPNYNERLFHALANQARVEPSVALEGCRNCGEAACYVPEPPLYYKRALNRAARFHADEMSSQGYFEHGSQCTVVPNISDLYPENCDGDASCACVGGVSECRDQCTGHQQRVRLFGTDYRRGEIIAGGTRRSSFFLWLHEPSADPECSFSYINGHRWVILKSGPGVGFGSSGYSVGEFGSSDETHPIASGIHMGGLGGQSFLANWYDEAAPRVALVNTAGRCSPLALERGVADNGSYTATYDGASSCTRYYFVFRDSNDEVFTYPTSGSLGVGGDLASCPTWTTERPEMGEGCDCSPSCAGIGCGGSDGCGGLCQQDCAADAGQALPGVDASVVPQGDGGTSTPIPLPDVPSAEGPTTDLHGGCGCRVLRASPDRSQMPLSAILFGLATIAGLRARRIGRRRKSSTLTTL